MEKILKYLKTKGQLLDSEIASALKLPVEDVRTAIADLVTQGEVTTCSVTRFNEGEEYTGTLCRIAGYSPPRSAGRAPKGSSGGDAAGGE